MAEEIKQAIPSPEDRVRAMKAEELLQKIEAAAWVAGSHDEFDYDATDLRAELLSRLSLVEELKRQVAAEKKADAEIQEIVSRYEAEAEKAQGEREEYKRQWNDVLAHEDRALARGRELERELGVMREALRRLRNNAMQGKVTSALIDEVDVFLFPALTPEPATKAEVSKK